MNATYTLDYCPQEAVPRAPLERAAWLDRHGAPPESATLSITLPLRRWADLAHCVEIQPDGRVRPLHQSPTMPGAFRVAALRVVAESGEAITELPPSVLDATVTALLAELAAAQAAADASTRRQAEEWAATLAQQDRDMQEAADREARRIAAADADDVQIGEWLEEHGTGSQTVRWQEGLLPDDELREAIREWVYAPLGDFTRFRKIKASEVGHTAECEGFDRELVCSTDNDDITLTAEQYETLLALRRVVHMEGLRPGCAVQTSLVRHTCRHTCCDAKATRSAARVEVTFAGIVLAREYKLAPAE